LNARTIMGIVLLAFLLAGAVAADARFASAYTPQKGDSFNYSETITVNDGQGSYSGYTDQTQVIGSELMNGVSGNIVSASYTYSFQFSSNQGVSSSNSSTGSYTWSSSNYTYVNGTDDQNGYSSPVYVWFAIDPSLPVGSTFYSLNTQFTVLSKAYSFLLPAENRYVQTIEAEGTDQYQRNDSYGVFAASYTWYAYYDPSTGYIVGYNYVEHDNGEYQGQSGGFTYTDDLYVTSTSYPLSAASAPPGGGIPYLVPFALGAVLLLIIVVTVLFALRRRHKDSPLPEHSRTPPSPGQPDPPASPPPPTPWQSEVNMGSQPSEQVVIREVAKVKCKYCGTLIPTTSETCPYCGAPQ
jgi:hypothetical protein